ncbi:hypothetical protein V1292_003005 [Bradyrhizobium sp. AZCC 1719]|uniref:hypothetical protein n=1 Tax=Bradyrhizobium sp. AZCC 1719 TaxID=3117028 RepID=UPI002FEF4004
MKPVEPLVMPAHRYGRELRDAKGKAAFSSNSKLMPGKYWNESKRRCCGKSKWAPISRCLPHRSPPLPSLPPLSARQHEYRHSASIVVVSCVQGKEEHFGIVAP